LAETLLSAGIGNPYTQRFHNETAICARGRIICRLINDFIWRRSLRVRATINIRVAEIMLEIMNRFLWNRRLVIPRIRKNERGTLIRIIR